MLSSYYIKKQKVANGELVLLTYNGMQSSTLEIYYTDSLGVNHWVTFGGDMSLDEPESLVSVCRNKRSDMIIFHYRSNTDRIYDIKDNHLIEKAHDDSTDNIVLFNLEQLKNCRGLERISEDKANKYRQALNAEIERNRLHK